MGCTTSSLQTGAAALEFCASLDRFERDFEIGKLIGKGADGEVYCASEGASSAEIAVKVTGFDPQGRKRKRARAEAEMLRTVGEHPNIVRLLGSFTTDDTSYILMERCECAIPAKFESNPQLLQEGLPRIFRGMLMGISACHRARVVHRDVKMDNFLMGIDGVTVKLCDFGVSRRLPPSVMGLSGAAGTVPLMSPEMVRGDLYDFGTDVWSFGATAYLLVFGELPYVPAERSRGAAKEAIRAGRPSPRFLGAAGPRADFLGPLLERDPLRRCTADEALAHPSLGGPREQPSGDPRGRVPVEPLEVGCAPKEVSSVLLSVQSIQGSLELLKSTNGSSAGLATATTEASPRIQMLSGIEEGASVATPTSRGRLSFMLDDRDLNDHEVDAKNDPGSVE